MLFYFPGQFIPNRNDPPGTQPATVTSLEQREGDSWQKLKFFAKNIKINNDLLGKAIFKRKPISEDFEIKAGTQIEVPAGQTVYFKSRITYRPTDNGEFLIETLGKNGGYGLLDPTYTGTHYGSKASTDSVANWYSSNWANRKKITIQKTKVSGGADLSNFPVLISMTDITLATTANGGQAASGSGEFVFTSSNGTTVLPHEIETYTATTGQFIGWVNVTTLSATADTTLYLYYGGPSSGATNQNKTGTWDANYNGVWHMSDGTTLSGLDSTGVHNGTLTNTPTAGAGKIDGAGSFVTASHQYIDLGTDMNPTAFTYSAWVNGTSFPNTYNAPLGRNETNAVYSDIYVKSNGKLAMFVKTTGGGPTYDGTGTNTLSTGTWYYVVFTYDSTNGVIGYFNGGVDGTAAANGAPDTTATTTSIGRDGSNANHDWNGLVDEARVSSIVRSADWIATEYNNQSFPNTFYSLGGLEARIPANPGLKIKGKVKFR